MLLVVLIGLLLVSDCSSQLYQLDPGITRLLHPLLSLLGVGWGVTPRPPGCGPCPARDCRRLPAIVLGFCCGCALPIDRVPVVCPPRLVCPPAGPRLCRDYNYLMECCC